MNIEIASSDNEILANWEDANAFCASLGTGWRLPTKSELNSIYLSDEKRANAIYWSASSSGGIAWVQNLGSGKQYCNNVENVNYVRPVRDLNYNTRRPVNRSIPIRNLNDNPRQSANSGISPIIITGMVLSYIVSLAYLFFTDHGFILFITAFLTSAFIGASFESNNNRRLSIIPSIIGVGISVAVAYNIYASDHEKQVKADELKAADEAEERAYPTMDDRAKFDYVVKHDNYFSRLNECTMMLSNSSKYPSEISFDWSGGGYTKSFYTDGTAVRRGVTNIQRTGKAMNGLGMMIPFTGSCEYNINIVTREVSLKTVYFDGETILSLPVIDDTPVQPVVHNEPQQPTKTQIPRSMEGDKGSYYLISKEKHDNIIHVVTERIGPMGDGYTKREIDCNNHQMRSIAYSEVSIEQLDKHPYEQPTKWYELVKGSSDSDIYNFVCSME
jgi:hypothetical protein